MSEKFGNYLFLRARTNGAETFLSQLGVYSCALTSIFPKFNHSAKTQVKRMKPTTYYIQQSNKKRNCSMVMSSPYMLCIIPAFTKLILYLNSHISG